MPFTIVLDSFPLGQLCNPRPTTVSVAIRQWKQAHEAIGNRFAVPEVADFEVRREMLRRSSTTGIALLDAFNAAETDRYLPVSTAVMRLAAQLWAQARKAGTPTADPKELDVDVILAAQARLLGLPDREFVVATSNVGHLAHFVPAALWNTILP
jgi:hypothetical protein